MLCIFVNLILYIVILKIDIFLFLYISVYLNSTMVVGLYSTIGSALECEASVLRSIHSSSELGTLRGATALRGSDGHYGLGRCLIHESQDSDQGA